MLKCSLYRLVAIKINLYYKLPLYVYNPNQIHNIHKILRLLLSKDREYYIEITKS